MSKITDIKLYNEQMSRSMQDKLFFLDYVSKNDIDTIIDFGCANGELLKQVPFDCVKIGVDNSPEMINEAKENFPDASYVAKLTDITPIHKTNALLNMSSVIHEVYSYLKKTDVDKFWDEVFTGGYKYIAIRDMMVPTETNRMIALDDLRKIIHAGYGNMFDDFHNHFLDWRVRDILHFFMKYRYEENWARECAEDYFPITTEELLKLIPGGYELVYYKEYCLDWVKDRVYQDFDYEIKDTTHVKLLLKRKN